MCLLGCPGHEFCGMNPGGRGAQKTLLKDICPPCVWLWPPPESPGAGAGSSPFVSVLSPLTPPDFPARCCSSRRSPHSRRACGDEGLEPHHLWGGHSQGHPQPEFSHFPSAPLGSFRSLGPRVPGVLQLTIPLYCPLLYKHCHLHTQATPGNRGGARPWGP